MADRQQRLADIAAAYESLNIDGEPTPEQDDALIDAIIGIEGINIIGAEWAKELAGMTDEEIAVLNASPLYKPMNLPNPPQD